MKFGFKNTLTFFFSLFSLILVIFIHELTFVTEIENKYTFNDNQDNTCNDFIFLFPNTRKENTALGWISYVTIASNSSFRLCIA